MKTLPAPRLFGLLLGLLLGSASLAPAADNVWYATPVPSGVRLRRMAAPTAAEPGQTLPDLEAALAVVRTNGPGTLRLHGGTYELPVPLRLTPADSGLTIAACDNEKPILSGSRRTTGWRPSPGAPGVWETSIPVVPGGPWYFRSLFVNGRRAQRTRAPKTGYFQVDGESPGGTPVRFVYHSNDLNQAWLANGDTEAIALLAWSEFRLYLRGFDLSRHLATLSGAVQPSNREKDARYFMENLPGPPANPGEWHLDRFTGLLQYRPPAGENPATAEFIAPHLSHLMELRGSLLNQRPLTNVTLRGLAFQHTDWSLPKEGYADTQAAVGILGDLRAEAATGCVIADCSFSRLSGYAIELGRGCQNDRIIGCEFADLGAGGIRVGDQGARTAPFEQNHSHIITDNHIHDIGQIYPAGIGVLLFQTGTNLVAHNEIDHTHYTAISVGWTWGYRETPCRENRIEFNHLHHIGQGTLSDLGAVYTLGPQAGTVLRNNLIHDVESHGYGGWGLYTDEGSTGILLENNVVYHCKSAGFHQHYGRDNVLRNNIFAFNREHQLMRTRNEEHTSFHFTNNIVLWDTGDLLGSNWEGNHFVADHNLYWDTRPGATPETLRFAGATPAAWRARGEDVHSQIADPRFLAPARFDFGLQPDSPALAMGFHPIDLSTVGPRPRQP